LLTQIAGQYPWRCFDARPGDRDADTIKDKLPRLYDGVLADLIGRNRCDFFA